MTQQITAVPVSKQTTLKGTRMRRLLRRPRLVISASLVLMMILMAAFPQIFTGFGPGPQTGCDILNSNLPPSAQNWFGYDPQGCDYYTNVIYGARASIVVGLLVSVASFVVSAVLGALAGFYGGWVDMIISRVCDIAFGLPFILAAIVILQLFSERSMLTVAFALALFAWPGGVRFMRASVLSIRDREFVQATRVLGGSDSRLIFTHIVPNALTPLLVLQTLGIGGAIGAEAGLTFIGIGLTPPSVSWGLQLSVAREYISTVPHLLVFPAVFLSVTVLAFVLFGEAMHDELDPKGEGR